MAAAAGPAAAPGPAASSTTAPALVRRRMVVATLQTAGPTFIKLGQWASTRPVIAHCVLADVWRCCAVLLLPVVSPPLPPRPLRFTVVKTAARRTCSTLSSALCSDSCTRLSAPTHSTRLVHIGASAAVSAATRRPSQRHTGQTHALRTPGTVQRMVLHTMCTHRHAHVGTDQNVRSQREVTQFGLGLVDAAQPGERGRSGRVGGSLRVGGGHPDR